VGETLSSSLGSLLTTRPGRRDPVRSQACPSIVNNTVDREILRRLRVLNESGDAEMSVDGQLDARLQQLRASDETVTSANLEERK